MYDFFFVTKKLLGHDKSLSNSYKPKKLTLEMSYDLWEAFVAIATPGVDPAQDVILEPQIRTLSS